MSQSTWSETTESVGEPILDLSRRLTHHAPQKPVSLQIPSKAPRFAIEIHDISRARHERDALPAPSGFGLPGITANGSRQSNFTHDSRNSMTRGFSLSLAAGVADRKSQ